jgi:hypothetical protein
MGGREPTMHRVGYPDLIILMSIAVIIFIARRPRKPPRFPRHPVPSHEPFDLFVRIKRRADLWRF